MPRNYIRKTTRRSWNQDNMQKAMADVQKGIPVNHAANLYEIPEATLRRYVRKYTIEDIPTNSGRFKKTFNNKHTEELKNYVIDIDKRAFGLTKTQFGKICYSFAEGLHITHRFNQEKKIAGRDFIEGFMKECKLVLRKPEATSAARLLAFNKVSVAAFFSLLKELRLKFSYSPNQIYNADETGLSTVPTKTPKIISSVGNRRVIKISSAERGTNITVVCTMNACGTFIPPYFIFPRVRMNPSFLNNVPPGSDGVAHETGWMTADIFLKYLEHFAKYACPSERNPILLLMDNHASHITLETIQFCKEHHIMFLGFPPHTTHKLQPLDVAFYGPLKTAYSQACESFFISNPGHTISIKDVPELFANAYLKTTKMQTAINGFKVTGIQPFDPNIFTDDDFAPAETTNRPTLQEYDNSNVSQSTHLREIRSSEINNQCLETNNLHSLTTPSLDLNNQSSSSTSILPPLPKAVRSSTRQRKKLPSFLITSPSVEEMLTNKRKDKENKENNRNMKKKKQEVKENRRLNKKDKKKKNSAKEINLKKKKLI